MFPVCARIARDGVAGVYHYKNHLYQLPIHGLAPYLPWQVTKQETDRLILSLTASAAKLLHYPFEFQVTLDYFIRLGQLTCRQTYQNLGREPMPYYAGFHPYFLVPDKSAVMLDYQPLSCLQYNEKLTCIAPEAIITLRYPEFNLHLQMQATDETIFNYLQLYTRADKPFFCVEPWMSFPNAMNAMTGVRWLAPERGESDVLHLWVS